MPDDYSFGIEEEYFLVDAETRAVVQHAPAGLHAAATEALGPAIEREFLQGQIEVATKPATAMAAARHELAGLRRGLAAVAGRHGCGIVAAGTHPTAVWEDMRQTPKARYERLMQELQIVGRRDVVCGLHVHVALPDPDRRVEVMARLIPYLPLFAALSTSSPFWQGRPTGLKSYRLAVYDEMPRTGLPELFRRREEYDAYVMALTRTKVIQDASFVWWMARPSAKLPTLELRAADACTSLDHSIALAALYRALVRHLVEHRDHNADISPVGRALADENKWRAERWGVEATFVSEQDAEPVPVPVLLDRLLERLMPDAEALGCAAEAAACRTIPVDGTSADHQLRVHADNEGDGDPEKAFAAVTAWLVAATQPAEAG